MRRGSYRCIATASTMRVADAERTRFGWSVVELGGTPHTRPAARAP